MTAASMRCLDLLRRLLLVASLALALPAFAHKASDAYLQLQPGAKQGIELRLDVALRDLDAAIDLDADGDGKLTWGEIKAAFPRIEAYALANLRLEGCPLKAGARGLEQRADGAYAVLHLASDCLLAPRPVVSYGLMRDIDPTHRGLLKIERLGQAVELVVLDPAQASTTVAAGAARPTPSFLHEGIVHILTGYDHVLFLICLLLPSVMQRSPGGWQPVERMSQAVLPILGIVTTFTVAHSITLGLAALRIVSLPASFIEPAIALTIVAAALDNLYPLFHGRRGVMTFFFGLVHGFGFAGALAELELPRSAFAWALFEFNFGIEVGQLMIVAVAISMLYALRRIDAYPRWAITGGSLVAIVFGAAWFIERTTGMPLLPL
jgi:hypothetical protein